MMISIIMKIGVMVNVKMVMVVMMIIVGNVTSVQATMSAMILLWMLCLTLCFLWMLFALLWKCCT